MNPFQSLSEYEEFVYTLPLRYPSVKSSTLVVARRGAWLAVVTGEVVFQSGYRLVVKERLTLEDGLLELVSYGYEIWHRGTKSYWYDSQPHPDDPSLTATHPHHKHIPPNIKHHRIPAPNMSLSQPNLPELIAEIGREQASCD